MLLHYIKVAVRNILKYKVQNVVNVCAIAVSLTLFAIGASILSIVRPKPMFSQPHVGRTVIIQCVDGKRYFTLEEYDRLEAHQFMSTGKFYPHYSGGILCMFTASVGDDEKSILAMANEVKDDYLRILGYKSTLHPGLCNDLPDNGIILTKPIARKLFGDKSPAGARVNVRYSGSNEDDPGKDYYVVDVMDPVDDLGMSRVVFLPILKERLNAGYSQIMAVLNEGSTPDDLRKELKEVLPDREMRVSLYEDYYNDDFGMVLLVVNGILIFLLVFVLVSVVNYLRQQIQLVRTRQREVALRTSLGAKAGSLYVIFCLDVVIVLTAALLLSLLLSASLETIVVNEYYMIINELWWAFDKVYSITLMMFGGILLLSVAAMILAVRHIKRCREGLALQMRPMPKHRLRNVGITFQLAICTVLMWMAVLAGMSRSVLREYWGIPADDGLYRRCYQVNLNHSVRAEVKYMPDLIDKVRRVESVEKIVSMARRRMLVVVDKNSSDYNPENYVSVLLYNQRHNEVVEFYGLDINVLNPEADPTRHIVVSEAFRKKLEEKGIWNGRTVDIWGKEYEVAGIYSRLPFTPEEESDAIVTDASLDDNSLRETVIVSRPGKEDETRKAFERIIREMFPSRVDMNVVRFYNNLAADYMVIQALIFLLLVLSVISVVTTVASIYAGVALDTRRRRKEMALRKINGARTGDIRRLFARSYVVIFCVSVLLSFALCLTISSQDVVSRYVSHPWIAYVIAVLIMAAIVVLTLAWRIRDVMRVNPAEYLKD